MSAGKSSARGRPRGFCVDEAIGVAQRLFQEKGYAGVGIAALTQALGINPPSFYAAFGSKAALFERVLDRYQAEWLPHAAHLRPGAPAARGLRAYLEAAARVFAADATTPGCLILESARDVGERASTQAARRRKQATRDAVAAFVRATHPDEAETIADFVLATTTGLSAAAREGAGETRLLAIADTAARAVAGLLEGDGRSQEEVP